MTPKVYDYENRLAKTVRGGKGLTAQEAIPAAQARVEQVRESSLRQLDADLAIICCRRGDLKAGCEPERIAEAYAAANRIVAIAGLFGLEHLGRAAYLLCDVLSHPDWAADCRVIEVQVDALRLLRFPEPYSGAEREAMLAALKQTIAGVVACAA